MKLKTVFTINSIISCCFGVCFMVVPAFGLKVVGLEADAGGTYMARFVGIMVFGLSILVFMARKVTDAEGIKAILSFLFACYILMLCFHVAGQLFFNKGNIMLWVVDILHISFALIYANFLFRSEGNLNQRNQIEKPV